MSLADIIQIIIGVLSLVATIAVSFLIYWLQSRHEKEIQKLQCEKERIALQEKARLFLIDNQEERDYLPWCIIAANLYPLEKHTRKIYSEYCRCSEELQNEILNQAGYKIKQFTGKYWLQGCIDKLQQDIEKYNLGRDYLYDGAKYFHRSYDRYRELEWNGTPNIFEPINKENRLMMILNVAQISIGEYIDEYFYYFVDKKMDFDKETPIPPIDYVWEYQSLAHTREETVCMWMMELVENIATIINNKFGEDVDCQFFLEYTDAQAETYEDKYYETVQALYNAYYTSVVTNKGVQVSNDGGIDGYGYHVDADDFRTTRVVIQCKRFNSNPVSEPDINQFLGAMNKYQADYGVFITNSRFTNKAREAAREGTPITLIDGNDLIRLVIKYELYITPVTTYVLDGFYTED